MATLPEIFSYIRKCQLIQSGWWTERHLQSGWVLLWSWGSHPWLSWPGKQLDRTCHAGQRLNSNFWDPFDLNSIKHFYMEVSICSNISLYYSLTLLCAGSLSSSDGDHSRVVPWHSWSLLNPHLAPFTLLLCNKGCALWKSNFKHWNTDINLLRKCILAYWQIPYISILIKLLI